MGLFDFRIDHGTTMPLVIFSLLFASIGSPSASRANENTLVSDITCQTRRVCETRRAQLRPPSSTTALRDDTSIEKRPKRPGEELETCYSVKAPPQLEWPTSGVWRGEELIFADSLSRSLIALEPQPRRSSAQAVRIPSTATALSGIRKIPRPSDEYLVEDEGGQSGDRLVRLDNQLNPVSTLQIDGRKLENGWSLDVIYDWQPVLSEGVVGALAFADIKRLDHQTEKWKSALIFFDERQRSRIFREWPTDLDFVGQNTRENGYIAVVGKKGYMLVWEAEPYLLKVDLTPSGLASEPVKIDIPEDLRRRPVLAEHPDWKFTLRGAEQLALHLETVESTPGVASILSVNSKLFLISKSIERGEVEWFLSELDTTDGFELSRTQLPVSGDARHLTLAVGESWIALLAKGSVENLGSKGWSAPFLPLQEITILPASWLSQRKGALEIVQSCS